MTKHTPGPWRIIDRRDTRNRPCGLTIISDQTDEVTFEDSCEVVCRLPDGATSVDSKCWPEQSANARLIAAAPDLADALRSVLTDCNLKVIGHGGRVDKAIMAARAALQKAGVL